jgi:ribonuclease VapC
MFLDTSIIVAILSGEDDAAHWSNEIEISKTVVTSPLVLLEAAMRLTTKLASDPGVIAEELQVFLVEAKVEIVSIDTADGWIAIQAFQRYGKGRGHPAQLNLADCLSYACAKNRGMRLLYKGNDFAATDLA